MLINNARSDSYGLKKVENIKKNILEVSDFTVVNNIFYPDLFYNISNIIKMTFSLNNKVHCMLNIREIVSREYQVLPRC